MGYVSLLEGMLHDPGVFHVFGWGKKTLQNPELSSLHLLDQLTPVHDQVLVIGGFRRNRPAA